MNSLPNSAKNPKAVQINDAQVEEAAREALEPFERAAKTTGNAEGPYQVQHDLQEMMQNLVGIVRREEEMVRALDGLHKLWERAQTVAVYGHREYNPGWHTAIDLKHLLTVSEAITRAAIERKESRGGHFRDDFPNKDSAEGKMNIVLRKEADGSMHVRREQIPEMPDAPETNHRRDEMNENGRLSKSGGATRTAETLPNLVTEISEGMVVLDAVHDIQAKQANDLACRWNCKAGKCGSCSAEINGMPKLMCMTRLDAIPLDKPVTIEPMRAFPVHPRFGHRRFVEFSRKEKNQEIQAAPARRSGRHLAHCPGGH